MGAGNDTTQLLYELQTIDEQMSAVMKAEESCTKADQVKQLQQRLEKVDLVVEKINEAIDNQRRRIRRLELEIKSLEDRIEKNENQMFDGSVKDAKGLSNLQEMLEADRLKKEEYEENAILRMERLEKLEGELDKTSGIRQTTESRLAEAEKALKQVRSERTERVQSLQAEREKVADLLSDDVQSMYDTVSKKMIRPISKVVEKTCTGCNMTLPTSFKAPTDGEILRCPHCIRLLWWPSKDHIPSPID